MERSFTEVKQTNLAVFVVLSMEISMGNDLEHGCQEA